MLDSPLDGIRSPFGVRRGRAFSPSTLFALAEPGVWFDPSDLTTLYQDPAGTTPVTAPGNTVGLMLDKSKGLALGAELVANGDFSGGSTGWNLGAGVTVSGGKANMSAASGYVCFRGGVSGVAVGGYYEFTFTISDYVSGSIQAYVGSTPAFGPSVSANGTYTVRLGPIAGAEIGLRSLVAFTGSIDDISVKAVTGNHATQATLAARPTYSVEPVGGRRNLLTFSEDFTNAAWTQYGATVSGSVITSTSTSFSYVAQLSATAITAVTHTLSAKVKAGTSSVFWIYYDSSAASGTAYFDLSDLSTQVVAGSSRSPSGLTIENLGGGDYRISAQWLTTVGNPTWGVGISNAKGSLASTVGRTGTIYNAQAELGSTATAYQRVTTQHDVTEAGAASVGYLWFNGVSNAMSLGTSTITPGTDKVQMFAGVRKLGNTSAIIAEFSAAAENNAGSFNFFNKSTNALTVFARGTTASEANGPVEAAPKTSVMTGLGDIAGDRITLRADGVQVAQSTADLGTGNFLAYPLYIGARASGAIPFTGHLYSLITRFGPTLDAPTISNTEIWVGDKTGIDVAKNISTTIYTRSGDTILDRANSTIERRAV